LVTAIATEEAVASEENVNVGGSLHRTLNRLEPRWRWLSAGRG